MRSPLRRSLSVTFFGALGALAPHASAEVAVDQCVDANTQAQALQRQGKLMSAREQLQKCVDAGCPALVRGDCIQRLDELERRQPSIVFESKDGEGHDVAEVKVGIDGRPFAERLDGIPLPADPGEHVFTFETTGAPVVTQRFVLREGEKGRRERIVLGATTTTTAAAGLSGSSAPESAALAPAPGLGSQRIAALAAFGVGVVGLGAGAAFAMRAKAKADDADQICSGMACSNDTALSMNTDARHAGDWATVAFAVGAAGIASGVILWLTAPSAVTPSAQIGVSAGTVRLRGTW